MFFNLKVGVGSHKKANKAINLDHKPIVYVAKLYTHKQTTAHANTAIKITPRVY